MTTVAVAGGGGALLEELRREHERVVTIAPSELFNLRSAERVLAGADLAVYAAGAVASAARVSQGSPEDLALLCADTFARAAPARGVRDIVYAGSARSSEVERALASYGARVTTRARPHVSDLDSLSAEPRSEEGVRSIQRLPLPRGRDAEWVAREYMRWLPRFMRPLVRVDREPTGTCRFYLRAVPAPVLVLTFAEDRSAPDRQLFFVTSGVLAHRAGVERRARLEFREVLSREFVLAALQDFAPSLPWLVYEMTQARMHLLVMNRFSAHLGSFAQR